MSTSLLDPAADLHGHLAADPAASAVGTDPPLPEAPLPEPPLPEPDVRLMQVAIEQAIRAGERDDPGCSEAELIDQIARLEALQHVVAAWQSDRIRALGRAHVASRTTTPAAREALDPDQLERSVAAQVALACRVSPTVGRRRLRTARHLHAGLDHVRGLFTAGELSPDKAAAIADATSDLDPDQRGRVDRRLAAHDLARLGIGRLRDLAHRLVAEIAPETFRARAATARRGRRVTLRPGGDGMCWLTAHLPVEQGAACLAALQHAVTDHWADPTATVTRTRGQTMADTLVERCTGQATAEAVSIEVQALVPLEALIGPRADLPAVIPGAGPGHSPIPVEHLLGSTTGRLTLRRLVTRDGIVIGGDSRQRRFTGVLADLIRARDHHRCREPYCDAPVRHLDHVHRHADGGPTSLDDGRGVCEFHNHLREQPGWTVHVRPDRENGGIATTTPTGHTYLSPTPRAA